MVVTRTKLTFKSILDVVEMNQGRTKITFFGCSIEKYSKRYTMALIFVAYLH